MGSAAYFMGYYVDQGQELIPSWACGGRVLWPYFGMRFVFFASLDDVFVTGSGMGHPAHCLR